MYGYTNKNDIYGKAKARWTTTHEKSKKKSDLSTDSDFEDSKAEYSHSFCEKSETQESLSKINTTLDEIKINLKSTHQITQNDNSLEYIKSIDSDTKNIIELLSKPREELKLEQITTLFEQYKKITNEQDISTYDIIKHLNLLNNKTKVSQDQLLCEMNTLSSNYDYLLSKIDLLTNTNNQLNQNLIKLKYDYNHVVNQLSNINTTLNKLLSFSEYQTSHFKVIEEHKVDHKEDVMEEKKDTLEELSIESDQHVIVAEVIEKNDIDNDVAVIDHVTEDDKLVDEEPKTIFKTTPKINRSTTKARKNKL